MTVYSSTAVAAIAGGIGGGALLVLLVFILLLVLCLVYSKNKTLTGALNTCITPACSY